MKLLYLFLLFSLFSANAQNFDMVKIQNLPGSSITSVAQLQGGDIIVGTPHGLWKTNTLFDEWTKINSPFFQDSMVYRVGIASNDNIIIGTRKGIYISTDEGASWTQPLSIAKTVKCKYIYCDKNNNVFIDAGAQLYRSKDGGNTWSLFAQTENFAAIAIAGTKAHISAAYVSADNSLIMKNYISTNNGSSFSSLNNSFANAVFYSGDDKGNVYAFINGNKPAIAASINNGQTWGTATMPGTFDIKVHRYFDDEPESPFFGSVLPIDNKRFLCTVFGSGTHIYDVRNDGTSLNLEKDDVLIHGLRSHYITCLYRLSDGTIAAGTLGSGLFISKNNALDWTQIRTPFNHPIVNDFFRDYKHQLFYAATLDGLYVSADHGNTWNTLSAPGADNNILAMTVVPQGDPVVLMHSGLYGYSYNQDEWVNINSKLPDGFYPNMLKTRGNELFIAKTGQALFSSNVGKSWTTKTVHDELITRYTDVPNTDIFVTVGPSNLFPKNIRFTFKKDWSIWQVYSDGLTEQITPTDVISIRANEIFLASSNGTYLFSLLYNKWEKPSSGWLNNVSLKFFVLNPISQIHAAGNSGTYYYDDKSVTWKQNNSMPIDLISCSFDNKSNYYTCSLYGNVYRSKLPTTTLGIPELISPAENEHDVPHSSAQTSWRKVETADRYHIQISTDPNFTNLVFNDSTVTVLSANPKTLKHTVRYYWRVRAMKLELDGDWSPVRTFITLSVMPEKITLTSPKNNEVNTTLTPRLIWLRPNDVDSFHVQLSAQENFSTLLLNDSTIDKTDRLSAVLSDFTRYYWRVRGKNRAGFGTWSDTWNFRTDAASDIYEYEEEPVHIVVSGSELSVHGLLSLCPCQLTISDMTGKEVLAQSLKPEHENITLSLQGIASGCYIIRIGSNTAKEFVRAFTIAR